MSHDRQRPRLRYIGCGLLLPLLLLLLAACGWGGNGQQAAPASAASISVGDSLRRGALAPDVELQTLDGAVLPLADLRGKAVVLNFWATWCFPCREEMPHLQAAHETYQGDGLVIVGVDVGEDTATVQRFVDDLGITFTIALDPAQEITRRFRVYGMPTTFFITRQGVIDYVFPGVLSAAELDRRIEQILQPDGQR